MIERQRLATEAMRAELSQSLLGTPGWQGQMVTVALALAAWRPWSQIRLQDGEREEPDWS